MSAVSLIIPTLFPPADLTHKVQEYSTYKDVSEVIVVSNDAQIDISQAPKVKVLQLAENLGFTGACNAGARTATGELLLFLNDDCQIDGMTLSTLLHFLDRHPDVVATQPIVNKPDGTIENIGFTIDTRIGKATTCIEAPSPKSEVRSDSPPIYGLSGACLLIKHTVFMEMGMFDETFHSYLEDVDLAIKLHKKGLRVSPCIEANVIHTHMATSSRMGHYKQWQDMKNWWRIILKHPDIFLKWYNLPTVLLERGRNLSGLIKSYLT